MFSNGGYGCEVLLLRHIKLGPPTVYTISSSFFSWISFHYTLTIQVYIWHLRLYMATDSVMLAAQFAAGARATSGRRPPSRLVTPIAHNVGLANAVSLANTAGLKLVRKIIEIFFIFRVFLNMCLIIYLYWGNIFRALLIRNLESICLIFRVV